MLVPERVATTPHATSQHSPEILRFLIKTSEKVLQHQGWSHLNCWDWHIQFLDTMNSLLSHDSAHHIYIWFVLSYKKTPEVYYAVIYTALSLWVVSFLSAHWKLQRFILSTYSSMASLIQWSEDILSINGTWRSPSKSTSYWWFNVVLCCFRLSEGRHNDYPPTIHRNTLSHI